MFEPNMDAIRDWIAQGRVASDLDSAARQAMTETPENRAILAAYRATFSTSSGQMVLEHLAKTTVLRSPVDHRRTGADYIAHAQLRQGQNQIMALIIELLQLAEQAEKETSHADRSERSQPSRDGYPDIDRSYDNYGYGWDFDPGGDIAGR